MESPRMPRAQGHVPKARRRRVRKGASCPWGRLGQDKHHAKRSNAWPLATLLRAQRGWGGARGGGHSCTGASLPVLVEDREQAVQGKGTSCHLPKHECVPGEGSSHGTTCIPSRSRGACHPAWDLQAMPPSSPVPGLAWCARGTWPGPTWPALHTAPAAGGCPHQGLHC